MSEIFVVGIGMTPFGRMLDRSVKDLTRQAVEAAMSDAATTAGAVGALFFSNATQSIMEGQHMISGQIALRELGFERRPIFNVENACAGGTSAFHLAYVNLLAGQCDVALAVGVEKMVHPNKDLSLSVFDGAWDVATRDETLEILSTLGSDTAVPEVLGNGKRSVFMDMYASIARHHMAKFGLTQRQIAIVSSKNHRHSTLNPLAQYRTPISVDEVLSSRMIAWPLTLPMCAPVSDGAAAAILCRGEALGRFDRARAIRIDASVIGGGSDRDPGDTGQHIGRLAALDAYERAGMGPTDMDLAEVHDASSFAEILQTENLGFCAIGEGGHLAESGATAIGGRIPVNPSGGLVSKGHPISATGLGQIHELVMQLRNEAGPRQVTGARAAIAENGGGFYKYEEAVAAITILSR
ncbi:MAG: thiolase family protein [Rhizobiaceae bacterium]